MEPFLTIVSGLPRSGTSMMMRMLEAGGLPPLTDHLRVADVDNPRGYYEFEPAKKTRDDPGWLANADGKVVKMVYQLLYDLPSDREYRVLFLRREMAEVLASQRKMLQRLGRDDGGIPDEKMAALFRSQLAKFETWTREQSHLKILEVDYNHMVADPRPQAEAINAFLGGDLDV
ncbi:hypothetical protein BH23PLA1_BH23PLA1_17470 [soil metagenome]